MILWFYETSHMLDLGAWHSVGMTPQPSCLEKLALWPLAVSVYPLVISQVSVESPALQKGLFFCVNCFFFCVSCICCALCGEGVGTQRTGKSSFLIPSSEPGAAREMVGRQEGEMLGDLWMFYRLSGCKVVSLLGKWDTWKWVADIVELVLYGYHTIQMMYKVGFLYDQAEALVQSLLFVPDSEIITPCCMH